jgi:branched-chain amino acid transport system substrate-binding protein
LRCYAGHRIGSRKERIARPGALADTLHANTFPTIVGEVVLAANGEWRKPRELMLQDRGVSGNGLEQFRQPAPYVILYPPQFKNGDAKTPFGD